MSKRGEYRRKKLPLDWRDTLNVGDVLISKHRDLRVVREVHYMDTGHIRSVTLAIRRCSWTKKSFTIINRTDLHSRGFTKAGVRARLNKPMDALFEYALQDENRFSERPCLTCFDVQGLA